MFRLRLVIFVDAMYLKYSVAYIKNSVLLHGWFMPRPGEALGCGGVGGSRSEL